jgi:hypothetical protein
MMIGSASIALRGPFRPDRMWLHLTALLALGMTTTRAVVGNGFVQDDLPLILRNETVHSLAQPTRFFTTPYWHDPFPSALYRPLATTGFALQWVGGNGAPRLFHLVSLLIYLGAGLAVLTLARSVLPPAGALIAAALFLVHPVHVEAVAPVVNQSELAVGLLLALGITIYIRERGRDGFRPGTVFTLFVLYFSAMLYKESALVFPALIVAAELTVVRGSRAALRPLVLALALAATFYLGARTLVLGGDLAGTFTADALAGLSFPQRILTMLAVVPTWARLLVWPAHLQADYSPAEIVAATHWGFAQAMGLTVALLAAGAVLGTRRRAPVIAFGLLWTAVGLLPVSNIVPTGIVLAERTLFLASIGIVIAAGGVLDLLIARTGWSGRGMALLLLSIVLALAVSRSRSRYHVWAEVTSLVTQTMVDAPKSYRAHLAYSRLMSDQGHREPALDHYRQAVIFAPGLYRSNWQLADRYRAEGLCRPAADLYERTLAVDPSQDRARIALLDCLFTLGRLADARRAAEEGLHLGADSATFHRALLQADSATTKRN